MRVQEFEAKLKSASWGVNMKGIFKKAIVIRRCEQCGRDIDVTNNENRKLCYGCQLMEDRKKVRN